MDEKEIRLEIVKAFLPNAAKNGLLDPEIIVEKCSILEKYVLSSDKSASKPADTTLSLNKKSRNKR